MSIVDTLFVRTGDLLLWALCKAIVFLLVGEEGEEAAAAPPPPWTGAKSLVAAWLLMDSSGRALVLLDRGPSLVLSDKGAARAN